MPQILDPLEPLASVRVWYLTTELGNIGGAERVNFELFRLIQAQSIDPLVICSYRSGSLADNLEREGVAIRKEIARSRFDFRVLAKLRKVAEVHPPDIVFFTDNAFAMFWGGVMKRLGLTKHLVLASHVSRSLKFPTNLAYRFVMSRLDRLIVLTPQLNAYWQKRSRFDPKKIVVIPNGIDTNVFCPPADQAAVRKQLGVPNDKIIVGTMAHLKPVKNLELFIRVARRVIDAGIGAHFLLVGDGPEQENLVRLVSELSLGPYFTFPGKTSDPAPWQQSFDIGLLTSHSEAMPLMVIEANACGTPVVSTEVGGLRDVIVHGETGYLTAPGDLDALSGHVIELCRDAEMRARMGAAARERVLARFSLEAMVRSYAALFHEVHSGAK